MAFKQPRVPEYRESEGTGKHLRSLTLFLKDFCMESWKATMQAQQKLSEPDEAGPYLTDVPDDAEAPEITVKPSHPVVNAATGEGVYPVTTYDQIIMQDGSRWDGKKLQKSDVVDMIYPVGSIYMSVNTTNPGTLFGGTWEKLENRFLLGAGSTYTSGNTGGSATHTLTAAQLPKIEGKVFATFDGGTHSIFANTDGVFSVSGDAKKSSGPSNNGANTRYGAFKMSFGSGASHNNMPPYLVVNMWKRTK